MLLSWSVGAAASTFLRSSLRSSLQKVLAIC
nr:MAG TPA: hypothetical protein [Caudoviricetes sp.]